MALIRCELKDDVRIIFIDDIRLVDGTAIEQCYREIADVLDKSEERNILLHFGRVLFLSSSALGMLIRVKRKCMAFSVVLKLCDIRPEIYEVFKITSLDRVFEIHGDAAEAIEAFKEGGHLVAPKHRPSSYDVS
jgi:anti-sigma B factor antagonist